MNGLRSFADGTATPASQQICCGIKALLLGLVVTFKRVTHAPLQYNIHLERITPLLQESTPCLLPQKWPAATQRPPMMNSVPLSRQLRRLHAILWAMGKVSNRQAPLSPFTAASTRLLRHQPHPNQPDNQCSTLHLHAPLCCTA